MPLPAWLQFDSLTLMIKGLPPESELSKTFRFEFVATDGYFVISDKLKFSIRVSLSYILKIIFQILGSLTFVFTIQRNLGRIYSVLCKSRYRSEKIEIATAGVPFELTIPLVYDIMHQARAIWKEFAIGFLQKNTDHAKLSKNRWFMYYLNDKYQIIKPSELTDDLMAAIQRYLGSSDYQTNVKGYLQVNWLKPFEAGHKQFYLSRENLQEQCLTNIEVAINSLIY